MLINLQVVVLQLCLAQSCYSFQSQLSPNGLGRAVQLHASNRKAVVPKEIVAKDYKVAIGIMGAGLGVASLLDAPIYGVPLFVFGSFLLFQVQRVNFVFDQDAVEIMVNKNKNEAEAQLEKSADNLFVGGRNRWKYSTFTKWGFVPSKAVPILFYFFETQTKPEGQFHLFPLVVNANKLEEVMVKTVGRK
eukprot:gene1262-2439_t